MRNSDKLFIIPIILLAANLLFRLIDTAKMLTTFPLDYVNDISAYISLLHFTDVYGFLTTVPNWYNGFTLFEAAAPGWYYFTLPLLWITDNIMLATYLSIILLYILAFIGIYGIGKTIKLSKIKRIAFFLFAFANPMLIGGILKQGRIPEFAALVILVYILWLALYYKDKALDKKLWLLAPLYAALILTHQPETILGSTFIIGLILIKNLKDKIKIIAALLLGILLSSFWLYQFVIASQELSILDTEFGHWLLSFDGGFLISNLILIALPLALFITFAFYIKDKKEKRKEFLFFLPILTLAFLVLIRILPFIPIFNQIYLDPWQDFFMLFTSFFLVSINYNKLAKRAKQFLLIILALLAIAAITYNMFYTPFFEDYTETEEQILSLIPRIDDTFLILTSERIETSYPRAYYAYAAIFYDKNSASGWGDWFKDSAYIETLTNIGDNYRETKDCSLLRENLRQVNVNNIITLKDDCQYLKSSCGFTEIASSGNACLLSTT